VRAAWITLLITEARRGCTSTEPLDSSSWAITRTLPVGIAMVDAEREILYCNETMQDLIAHKDALDVRGNRLIALREEDDQMLGALVRRAASGDDSAGKRSFMALTRSAYGVAVELASPQTGDTPVITIQVSEPDRGLELSRIAIRAFFGLTPTEAEIAARLADGDDIGEIAAALDIRPGTVRVHLRSIYRKTRVTRQGELVRLVLCSVARFAIK
jgi:DNA-binding CsgD family transcriptional regulator